MRPLLAAAAAAVVLFCPEAFAVAQRTFVSTAGSDANTVANCSLVSPCRSFSSALTVTQSDGEIVVLDSGGYGRVTIDKSVAIIAPAGVYAGISVFFGTNGVDVNGAGIVVALRGLIINGQGGATGILFTQGARLYIEQCTISNVGLHGIALLAGETFITDTIVRDNGSNGIWAEGSIDVTIDRTRIERNGSAGVRVLNGPTLTVTASVVAGNLGIGGFDIDGDDGSSHTVVAITESSISRNVNDGINAGSTGAGSLVRLALARNALIRNNTGGVIMSADTGILTATITDNVIARSGNGIYANGAGLSATIAMNAISTGNGIGLRQVGGSNT